MGKVSIGETDGEGLDVDPGKRIKSLTWARSDSIASQRDCKAVNSDLNVRN